MLPLSLGEDRSSNWEIDGVQEVVSILLDVNCLFLAGPAIQAGHNSKAVQTPLAPALAPGCIKELPPHTDRICLSQDQFFPLERMDGWISLTS